MENKEKLQTVVQGEASESDEEDDVNDEINESSETTETTATTTALSAPTGSAIISGEASESEEEEVNTDEMHKLPALKVELGESGEISHLSEGETQPSPPLHHTEAHRPKYNSLLHRKLRDRNVALRQHIVDTVNQTYIIAAKDLHNNTLQLQKTHVAIQDVSHHMRLTTNDLFHLEDKVDIVTSCNILPDININVVHVGN